MSLHRRDYPLLGFLEECNKISLDKTILDCGAGGRRPPLAIFHKAGYKTFGIDILDSQIALATEYAKEHHMVFNIIKGDMRKLFLTMMPLLVLFIVITQSTTCLKSK